LAHAKAKELASAGIFTLANVPAVSSSSDVEPLASSSEASVPALPTSSDVPAVSVVNPPKFLTEDKKRKHVIRWVSNDIERELRRDGGFTIGVFYCEQRKSWRVSYAPKFGFLVSVKCYERRLTTFPTSEELASYFDETPLQDGEFWGGWYDTVSGFVFLDVNRWYSSASDAQRAAVDNGQLAIYSLAIADSIRVSSSSVVLS
jgi:hypothetical protein